jgi:signal transduction histidine kinase
VTSVSFSSPAKDEWDVGRIETSYSNFGELVLAIARVTFRVVLTVRFLAFPGPWRGDPRFRLCIAVGSFIATIAFSAWVAARARRQAIKTTGHVLSATVDVALCFVSLLSTALWPEKGYPGLLQKPDVAFLSILVFGSALRLVPAAIAVSTVGSLASLVVLAHVDAAVNAPGVAYRPHDVQMAAILIGTAAVAAWFSAVTTRRALLKLARETELASRGRNHLREVLRDHHDVRTLLSAARLRLDLLVCEGARDDVRSAAVAATRAMAKVADAIEGIRERTFGELVSGDRLASVELAGVAEDVVGAVRARFPAVHLRSVTLPPRTTVALFGGERALVHVLLNLLVNACEGDGHRGADHVDMQLAVDPERPDCVRIDVIDDGPGFPGEVLRGGPRRGLTTKTHGGGMGLGLIAGLVEASGGGVFVANRVEGGACASVWLPRAPAA